MRTSLSPAATIVLKWVYIIYFIYKIWYVASLSWIKARRPALTLQIAEDYFNNNLEGETGYTLENGHYTKTIGEDDLTFGFSADTDGT